MIRMGDDDVVRLELQIAGQVVARAFDRMADGDVQVARLQLVRQGAGAAEHDLDRHLRQLSGDPLDDGPEKHAARGRPHSDPDNTGLTGREPDNVFCQ